jgi:hypothetical protein
MSKAYTVKLKNNTKAVIKQMQELKKCTIRVGVIGQNTAREDGVTNAFLLFLHTWGSITGNLPARPVLDAVEIKQNEFDVDSQKVIKNFVRQKLTAIMTARQIGMIALYYTLMSFQTKGFGRWPELQPETIEAKNSNAILIDTGELRRSITTDVIVK